MSRLGAIGAPIKGLTSEVEFTSRTGKHIRCQRQLASANLIQTLIGKSMELAVRGCTCVQGGTTVQRGEMAWFDFVARQSIRF